MLLSGGLGGGGEDGGGEGGGAGGKAEQVGVLRLSTYVLDEAT